MTIEFYRRLRYYPRMLGYAWDIWPHSSDDARVAIGHSSTEETARKMVEQVLGPEPDGKAFFGTVTAPDLSSAVCRRSRTPGQFVWGPFTQRPGADPWSPGVVSQSLQAALVQARLVGRELVVDFLSPLDQSLDRDRDPGQLPDDLDGAADAPCAYDELQGLGNGNRDHHRLPIGTRADPNSSTVPARAGMPWPTTAPLPWTLMLGANAAV